MSCPESPKMLELEEDKETINIRKENLKGNSNTPGEGSGGLDFSSFRNPKTWKKSISSFFRTQLRSTRSNEGDRPSGSNEQFPEDTISPEQKWQSLGKMFRRSHLGDHFSTTGSSEEHQHKKSAVKKVWSHYFGKHSKSMPPPTTSVTENADEK